MRYGAATAIWGTVLAFVIVLAVIGLYAVRSQTPVGRPSPSASPSPSTAVTASPSPSERPSPTPAPSAPGDATVVVSKVTVPPEFHYLVLGSGEDFRVVVLDLDKARTMDLASIHLFGVRTAPAQTSATVSASTDGHVILLLLSVPEAQSSLFVLRPETGESRLLFKGAPTKALVSPDGTRFALARADADRASTGLWIGSVEDGSMTRLVADEPQFVGSPPVPFGFSPAGTLLIFGVGLGEAGYQGLLAPVSSAEARVDRAAAGTKIVGGDVTLIGPVSGAEFRSEQEAFLWSSRSAFGGDTLAYAFDLTTKSKVDLYRPQSPDSLIGFASWRPRADQFATTEQPICCGLTRPQAAWLRDRGGSARKLGDYSFLVEMWWSRDGSKLFGRMGGDDATGGITDLLTAKSVMAFCLRGGTPGSCT